MKEATNNLEKFLEQRWATHTLFWVSTFFLNVAQQNIFGADLYPVIISYAVLLPSQMISAYFLTYYLIPVYFYKKKYLKFGLTFLASVYSLAILARILTVYVAEPFFVKTLDQESILEILAEPIYLFVIYVPTMIYLPIFMASIKIIKDTYKEKERIEKLKQEKTKAELNYLKAQIHPHFLLNTLNNLYALTLKKSNKAPETVIKLSEMLIYILYKCDEKLVLLENEIKLIENYISLEKLRYGDRLKLSFEKKISDSNAKIAPLILLSIVENAFKHGVSGEVENSEINIVLKYENNSFSFDVYNTKSETLQEDKTKYKKGIGITNVQKQLDLVYPNAYDLEILEKEKSYSVLLKLQFDENEN